jgi:hypothetical protein
MRARGQETQIPFAKLVIFAENLQKGGFKYAFEFHCVEFPLDSTRGHAFHERRTFQGEHAGPGI